MSSTVCLDKIVDNKEQPHKQRNSMQAGQSFGTRHCVGKSTDIVNMKSTVFEDKIVDNTEQQLKARQSTQTGQSF